MNDNLCIECGKTELEHGEIWQERHEFTPNPLRVKLQALEARLEKAGEIVSRLIESLEECAPYENNRNAGVAGSLAEAQAFLAEEK